MFRALIALLMLFAVPAFAGSPQQRPPKWWQGPPARELGLSTEQSNRIEEIHQAAIPRIQAAMQDRDTAQKDLDKLISGDRTTETDVIQKLIQVQAASNEINRQFVLMLFREYRELRPEQRAKVKAMRDRQRDQDRRGRGRGEPQHTAIKK